MRWIEVLNEGVGKYMPMFRAYIESSDHPDLALKTVKDVIRGHEQVYKRPDRIVWCLRWTRLSMTNGLQEAFCIGGKETKDKLLVQAAEACGFPHIDAHGAKTLARNWQLQWESSINHFLGTSCPAIQQYPFGREHPDQLLAKFKAMEEDWRKGLKGTIDTYQAYHSTEDFRPQPTVFLQLDDEWAWYDLNIDACDLEGEAMGHCGNQQARRDDDTVLSFRKQIDDRTVRPSLTFILHGNGMLGEMKGRENKKPHAKYFPAIIALLNDPRIHGIEGGGYEPENNFSVFDLPEKEAKALIAKKPGIAPVADAARAWTASKADWIKQILDKEAEAYFANEDVVGVDTENARVIVRRYSLDQWHQTEVGSQAPSYKVREFYDHFGLSMNNAVWQGFMKALVPLDKGFALEGVNATYEDGWVIVQLPYSAFPHAFTENRDQADDEGPGPLMMQCHDSLEDDDYEEPSYESYSKIINYDVIPLPKRLAKDAIADICDSTIWDTPDAIETAKILRHSK